MCFSGKPHSSTGVNHGATIVKMDRVEVVVFDFGLEDGPVGVYSCVVQLSETGVLEKMEPCLANKPAVE